MINKIKYFIYNLWKIKYPISLSLSQSTKQLGALLGLEKREWDTPPNPRS
jgi:hypothetical protein